MRVATLRAALAASLCVFASVAAFAQAPRPGNAPLAFDPEAGLWAFRQDGRALVCQRGAACKPLAFDGVAEDRLAAADIVALGRADRVFYLSLAHPEIEQGQARLFRCTADGCRVLATDPAALTALGTIQVRQRGRAAGRVAILANPLDGSGRSRILLCDDDGCAEQAATRSERFDFVFVGRGREDGRTRLWLRDKAGAIVACSQDVEDESPGLTCLRTDMNFPDVPDTSATSAEGSESELTKSLEEALTRGDLAEAERLLSEAQARFPGKLVWASYQVRVSQLRSAREQRQSVTQAQRLVAQARRAAQGGDFATAIALLNEAARIAPSLAEIPPARAEIARLKAQHDRRLNDRAQFVQAIEESLGAFRLWQAEELLDEAQRRFPGDRAFADYRQRLVQMRARAEWQGRVRQARAHIAAARRAMGLGDFAEADRELARAAAAAPGLPEIGPARADLARLRIDAEWQADEIRQITASIDAALRANRLVVAERLLADGQRRFPRHAGWSALERRLDRAKSDTQLLRILAAAQNAIVRNDLATAERLVGEAERLAAADPRVRSARADLERAKRAKAGRIRTLVTDARAAIGRKDFAAADRALDEAERLDATDPNVRAARADLARAMGAGAATAARVKRLVTFARDAIGRKDFAAADRALDEAEKLDGTDPDVKAARADLARAMGAGAATAARVKRLVTFARDAIGRKDFAAADRALDEAEKLDAANPDVKAARAELVRAAGAGAATVARVKRLVAFARAAIGRKDFADADRALDEAEKLDGTDADVKAARAELVRAQRGTATAAQVSRLVAFARAAIGRKDFANADKALDQAEKLDSSDADVKAARAELVRATSAAPPRFDEAKLRVIFYRIIMSRVAAISVTGPSGPVSMAAAYRSVPGIKALAFCVDWNTVRDNFVAPGAAGAHVNGTAAANSMSLALGECGRRKGAASCACTVVDVNGGNALRVPKPVIDRLNK